jgi:hypothetical protein
MRGGALFSRSSPSVFTPLVAVDQQVDSSGTLHVAPVSERFGLCSSGGWCWANPMPHGHDLRASWAVSADDIWAVTGAGGLVRLRRGEWSTVSTGIAARTMYGAAARTTSGRSAVKRVHRRGESLRPSTE